MGNFMTMRADGLCMGIQENRFEDAERWLPTDDSAVSRLMNHQE